MSGCGSEDCLEHGKRADEAQPLDLKAMAHDRLLSSALALVKRGRDVEGDREARETFVGELLCENERLRARMDALASHTSADEMLAEIEQQAHAAYDKAGGEEVACGLWPGWKNLYPEGRESWIQEAAIAVLRSHATQKDGG